MSIFSSVSTPQPSDINNDSIVNEISMFEASNYSDHFNDMYPEIKALHKIYEKFTISKKNILFYFREVLYIKCN